MMGMLDDSAGSPFKLGRRCRENGEQLEPTHQNSVATEDGGAV